MPVRLLRVKNGPCQPMNGEDKGHERWGRGQEKEGSREGDHLESGGDKGHGEGLGSIPI